jgi:hypothetical protein
VAAQALTGAVTATGAALTQALGEDGYKQVAAAIWGEGGRANGQLAEAMGLPRPTDAPSLWAVGETLVHLTMGPEFVAEVMESSPERVVVRVTSCPWAKRAKEQGVEGDACVPGDHAWNVGVAEYFGLKLTHEITTAMPRGDEYCTAVYQLEV